MAAKKTAAPVRDLACPKCGEGPFGVLEKEIDGHLLGFVRCEWCHTVIYVINASPNYSDITHALGNVEHAIDTSEKTLKEISRDLKKR